MDNLDNARTGQVETKKFYRLNLYQFLSLFISVSGFIAVVVSILVTKHTISASLASQMSSWTVEMDKMFIEHPEIRPYFYDDKDIDSTNPHFGLASTASELILDGFDAILGNRYWKLDPIDKNMWEKWMVSCFNSSPLLCRKFEEMAPWYSPEIKTIYENWKTSR